jgi:SAM-dependent methyltransferase
MESEEESIRLDLKTDPKTIKKQAIWAGLKPGMRVADLGCGPGKTTFFLNKLVQPNGSAVGVDISQKRINYARVHYKDKGIEFLLGDIRNPLDNLGLFDFIWIRFVLEHYCSTSFDIVKNISSLLKPGGIICLIDLDYNCLRHFGLSDRLNIAICEIMKNLEKKADFDPYVGIKLYSFLFDLGYQDIDVSLDAHHLIFGELKETDEFNWRKKVEIAGKNSGYKFEEYERGYEEFFEEFKQFFSDPRRFTYTPIISCRGCKPKIKACEKNNHRHIFDIPRIIF